MAAKKKPARRKRGRPSTQSQVDRALDDKLTAQMQRSALAVFGRIEKLAQAGEAIPVTLLGAARLCAEWHTDYLTVKAAMPDLLDAEQKPAA